MKLRMEVAGNGRAGICLACWNNSDSVADKVDRKFGIGDRGHGRGCFVVDLQEANGVSLSKMEAEVNSASHLARRTKTTGSESVTIGNRVPSRRAHDNADGQPGPYQALGVRREHVECQECIRPYEIRLRPCKAGDFETLVC
uniref:AlNc14C146G7403 protein n=1 Tax=Albugo laibachii Nc14 TaxID=890382 RepID=F0WLL5_9STRA|nr:AlNc14C146G7403 [Albugo laibachii Nc14]|eukprot:CCA22180.1 AlNc14C146G7403 [Albugo laibachii Nc14]